MPSIPEVTTRSPTLTSAVPGTWSKPQRPSRCPTTTPWARDALDHRARRRRRGRSAAAPSPRARRQDDAADDARRRDDRHVRAQSVLRALVDRDRPEVRDWPPPAMTSAAVVLSGVAIFRSSSFCSMRDCWASARSCCSADAQLRHFSAQLLVLLTHLLQREVVLPHVADAADRRRGRRAALRRTCRRSPPRATGTPRAGCTCAEISMMCPTTTAMKSQPVRCRISSRAITT